MSKRSTRTETGRSMFDRIADSIVNYTWFGPGSVTTRNSHKRKLTIKTPDGKKYVVRFEEVQ